MVDRKLSSSANEESSDVGVLSTNVNEYSNTNSDSENSASSTSPSTFVDLEIQDIEGVGPTTARKLKEAGIVSVMDLAVTSADELAVDINSSKDTAATFIMAAQRLLRESNILEKEFVTAESALEKRKSLMRCSTGSRALDELLLGGIETQAVTEFYGEFGSGKSQICHTLAAIAPQPKQAGGLNGGVIYIDTEGTFRPERLNQIARARELEPSHVLKNVAVCKVYNSSHLELIIKDLGKYVNDFNAKLVIIDSIISLHRAEFAGRGTLADRQQRLNGLLHKVIRLAEIFNIAVVITNQVQSSPDTFFGDPTKAAGGNVIGHASTYRIYLRKSGENRTAKMIDSPYHPYSDAKFTLNEKGTDDLEDELSSSSPKKRSTSNKKAMDKEMED
ncbi:MAG TPA: DNA repair and recombination protein RadA [Nitrososphaeraceae archaeon]|nr:DNA repair and recombination protein RadA [Nitrososphaeraceae archaeon]